MDITLKNKNNRRAFIKFLVVCAVLAVIITVPFYDGLVTKRYTVSSPHVKSEHTYVVITDLHSTYYGEDQMKLVKAIEKASPEAIFLVGDISEDRREFDGTAALLEKIGRAYPCYYVTGNHERWVSYTGSIKELFESYGVTVLDGKSVDLGDGVILHGIDDPSFFDSSDDFRSALEDLSPKASSFDILLSHRPEYAPEYAEGGFDLTLCGHAHGGQVRIPLILNGLYAPHQGFFPDYAGGRYDINGSVVIVSRGLMIDDLPRIFNPPELVIVTVKPETDK